MSDTIEEAAIFLELFEPVNIEFSFDTTNTDILPTIKRLLVDKF